MKICTTHLIYTVCPALCTRSFHDHCLLFLSTKKDCHRMCIILGLFGLKAVELHGNLTMLQVSIDLFSATLFSYFMLTAFGGSETV